MALQKGLVRSAEQLVDNIDSQQEAVVDARSPGRFKGTAPEPRPGIPSGHIPGSRNVPFSEVLSTDGRCGCRNTVRRLAFEKQGCTLVQSC
jgi:thiosulfate/3-mercaptopyruvate sulfurtransferase